jgi:hypothetical protein
MTVLALAAWVTLVGAAVGSRGIALFGSIVILVCIYT